MIQYIVYTSYMHFTILLTDTVSRTVPQSPEEDKEVRPFDENAYLSGKVPIMGNEPKPHSPRS